MKTIKERAVEYVTELMGMIDENKPLELEREHFAKIIEETAIAFATEQKAIDKENVKRALEIVLGLYVFDNANRLDIISKVLNSMEE